MKHRHKLKSVTTCILSLVLCCAMALEAPAFSAHGQELATTFSQEALTLLDKEPVPALEEEPAPTVTQPDGQNNPEGNTPQEPSTDEGTTEEGQSPEDPEDSSTPESSPEPEEPEEPQEPEIARYTVTYQMGSFGSTSLVVDEGKIPSLVPSIPELPAATILGWFDNAGNQVDPTTLPITGDVTYTARWSRQVEDLLNTKDHVAYISGYNTGMFLPDKTVTRAEAASMFYKLLLSADWEKKTFPDVKSTDWYADAVETLAGLGVVSGYENGKFSPTRKITRAEFVTMAMAFSTLEYGASPFTDVENTSWAAPYIYSAAKQGWISGMGDGTFAPNDSITRAQAVTILNKMLGRTADPDVKSLTDVKNFYDLFSTHWAYEAIVEASTAHTYHLEGENGEIIGGESSEGEPGEVPGTDGNPGEDGGQGQEEPKPESSYTEVWDTYEKDTSTVKSHWVRENGVLYYVDGSTRKIVRGKTTIDGTTYLFDNSGAAYNGFSYDGSWRRYYQNGLQVNDISGLGVVSGPYYIKVYKPANYLIIFAKDPSTGTYNTPVRSMLVSCGTPTPTGTYYTPARYRWLKMVGDTWAQWCTQIQGNYLFHSVPNWTRNNFDLEVGEYNRLGQTRSMGCIRLCCRDAKWIYDNCQLGTQVYISPSETSGPLSKPTGLQLPSWHTWDPTDPTAYYACQKRGCH